MQLHRQCVGNLGEGENIRTLDTLGGARTVLRVIERTQKAIRKALIDLPQPPVH